MKTISMTGCVRGPRKLLVLGHQSMAKEMVHMAWVEAPMGVRTSEMVEAVSHR